MIVQDIYLEEYTWFIRVYYAVDQYYISNILIDLTDMNCDKDAFFRIKSLMEMHKKNIGFTYSNIEEHCTLVLIGVTDDAEEFQSTYDHEKGHVVMHISRALGIEPYGEECQYLAGEVGKQMFKEAKKLMCDNCRRLISNYCIGEQILSYIFYNFYYD